MYEKGLLLRPAPTLAVDFHATANIDKGQGRARPAPPPSAARARLGTSGSASVGSDRTLQTLTSVLQFTLFMCPCLGAQRGLHELGPEGALRAAGGRFGGFGSQW